jgi:uncharacterized zinc-type alcohol dehydrogenase-like protein
MSATYTAKSYAATSPTSPLGPYELPRRVPKETDVQIDIQFCGVCHSDLHAAKGEWSNPQYPLVPGHEIVGRVAKIGSKVTKFKVGDLVGVGCLVDADLTCEHCKIGNEQHCNNQVWTYSGADRHLGGVTQGGYSDSIVVNEHFVLRMPENLDPAAAAPLLCAGITTYSPLHHWKVSAGQTVGIVGLGGLGHMGVKFARAMGAHVVAFTTSNSKKDDALRLGAHEVVVSTDPEQMKAKRGKFHFILDTVAADHDINQYLSLLRADGTVCFVGAPPKPLAVSAFSLLMGRKSLSGSGIGGIAETQEMLDFCGKHNIVADVEVIPIQKINEAWERVLKSDVKFRFVIDMSSLKN